MASRSIMITETAYEHLKAARRDGESFTEVIMRLLEGGVPRLTDFATLFDPKAAAEIGASFDVLRAEEVAFEKAKLKRRRRGHGHDA